jgi:hypothetical protein
MLDLHARMVAAVLDGEGLRGIAEVAASEAGGPVAIVLPARGLAACSADGVPLDDLVALAVGLSAGSAAERPPAVAAEHAVVTADETVGHVFALRASRNGVPDLALDLDEILRATALAALTEVAVADARDELASEVRGTLLEDLRAGSASPDDALRRAARLGCDLRHGGMALVAEVRSLRPHHVAALVRSEHPGALAELLPAPPPAEGEEERPGRVYAIRPSPAGDDSPERTLGSARALAARLRSHGPAAFSSFCAEPGELGRGIAEAELALEVVARDERMAEQLEDGISSGVYRLLFRALVTEPDEVRRFYDDTVEPLVQHDERYRTDLRATLEAYLDNDCNMNATARALYAHRHTVSHRLSRVRELTDLDPAVGEDRERLGLGLKAYRIIAPTLPR